MYSTSANYKNTMRLASRPYDTVYGTITFTNNTTMAVNSSIMPTNAISISKQCIDGGALMFGGVFLSVLKLSLITDRDRYAFFGATIELTYKVQIGTETIGTSEIPVYEEVPLGVFVVSNADRLSNQVNLTAYDKMTLLDKELGGMYLSGTPWQVLSFASEQTGYQLSFDENHLATYINYNYTISISEDQGIKTYRDVVKEVCQLLGCFALDDRTGKLALKKFSQSSDLTLGMGDWYSCVPADYECNYVALSVTSIDGTFYASNDDPTVVGNIMVIEDAPAWDYGSAEAQQAKTNNLYNYLADIDYTPCDIDMPSDPSFDCGDRLTLNAKINGVTRAISTLITSLEWRFHSGMSVTSEGINPYLNGGSALATESQRILNQAVEKSKVQFVSFTNNKAVTVNDGGSACIGSAMFTPTAQTNALFVATILVDIDVADEEETTTEDVTVPVKAYDAQQEETVITDINGNPVTLSGTATNTYTYARDGKCGVKIHYTLTMDNEAETKVPSNESPYIAIEETEKGQHIITVCYPITSLIAYHRFNWKIYITADGGTITVPIHTVQASIFGQEITSLERFNGEIVVDDETITLVNIAALSAIGLADSTNVVLADNIIYNINENLSLINIAYISIMPLSEEMHLYLQNLILSSEDSENFILEDDSGRLIVEDNV